MTLSELNSEFDILFEDLATAGSKGLDLYEKSVCLTYAQEQLVKELAQNGRFEPITKLIKTTGENALGVSLYVTALVYPRVTDSVFDISFYGYDFKKNIPGIVVPKDVIDNMLLNDYQYPPKNLVYVMVGENSLTVFPPLSFDIKKFYTRYVKYPTPVILRTLTNPDSINGFTVATLPILDETFHRSLVYKAVQFAVNIYIGQPEQQQQQQQNGSPGN